MTICQKRLQLTENYNAAALAYSELARKENASFEKVPEKEYKALKEATALARRDCDAARKALERHVAEHHCG